MTKLPNVNNALIMKLNGAINGTDLDAMACSHDLKNITGFLSKAAGK